MKAQALVSIDPKEARAGRSGMGGAEPSLPEPLDTSALESEMWRFRDAMRELHQSYWYLKLNSGCAPNIGMGHLSEIEALFASALGKRALDALQPASKQDVSVLVKALIKKPRGGIEDPKEYVIDLSNAVAARNPSRLALVVACRKLQEHKYWPWIPDVLEALNSAMQDCPAGTETKIREQVDFVRDAILREQEREQKLREEQEATIRRMNEPAVVGRFEDLIELAKKRHDLPTLTALERDVRLVRFEDGKLEIAIEPGAPKSRLVGELSLKLAELTGGRPWLVVLSGESGAPTVHSQRDVLAWLLRSDKPEVIAAAEKIQRALMDTTAVDEMRRQSRDEEPKA